MTDMRGLQGRTALYRLFDADGTLLYAGIAAFPKLRWMEHAGTKPWWHLVTAKTIEWFDTRGEALTAEAHASRDEKPKFDQTARLGGGHCDTPRRDYDDREGKVKVHIHMESALLSGSLKPGDSIKATALARQLGVAPATAKDALRLLQTQRVIESRGGGYFRILGR